MSRLIKSAVAQNKVASLFMPLAKAAYVMNRTRQSASVASAKPSQQVEAGEQNSPSKAPIAHRSATPKARSSASELSALALEIENGFASIPATGQVAEEIDEEALLARVVERSRLLAQSEQELRNHRQKCLEEEEEALIAAAIDSSRAAAEDMVGFRAQLDADLHKALQSSVLSLQRSAYASSNVVSDTVEVVEGTPMFLVSTLRPSMADGAGLAVGQDSELDALDCWWGTGGGTLDAGEERERELCLMLAASEHGISRQALGLPHSSPSSPGSSSDVGSLLSTLM